MKKNIFLIFILINFSAFSQHYNFYQNNDFRNYVMMSLNSSDSIVHSTFSPLQISYVNNIVVEDDIFLNKKRTNFAHKMPIKWFWRKLLVDDFLTFEKTDLTFSINPLINYYKISIDNQITNYRQNTRGFEIHGSLGKKLSFYSDFFETQSYFVPYIDSIVEMNFIVPGEGSWKIFGADKKGKDYNSTSGYISFQPNKSINIQLGHSKHFIGSGYRSFLLSDNSYNYPFLKFSFTKNKFQYNVLFTEFQSFKTKYYFYHYKKHASFVNINYSPISNIELSFFEGIIWQTSDDSTYVKKFPALFFVPIPGISEAVYGLNNENNIVLGFNARIKILKYADIYSQFALDNYGEKSFDQRYAYQVGIKFYDLLFQKIKNSYLFLQTEYNYSTPYTFSHAVANQSYSNYNSPLGHTLGAGFKELIIISNLRLFSFQISYKYLNILSSADSLYSNFGSNILLSNKNANFVNNENFIGQGINSNIIYHTLTFAYIINPKVNLQLFIDITKRNFLSNIAENKLFFISFGIKNSIKNNYTDF